MFNFLGVLPLPLTVIGPLRSKIFSQFECPYRSSYLTSIDTFSLSHIVFEIFHFKVFRVGPWPSVITWDQKYFHKWNDHTYMTSYLTSIDTFSMSNTVFEIFDFKVFRVWPWPLQVTWGQKYFHHSKDFLSNFYWHFLSISYRFGDIWL